MANDRYDFAKQEFASAGIDWLNDDIKAVLVTGGYTPNLATHQYLDDIPGGAVRVDTSGNLTGKTNVGGVCDADDFVYSAVSGAVCPYLIVYKDTGVEATSTLICLFDTGVGLPITPNGFDITVTWDNGVARIFAIG